MQVEEADALSRQKTRRGRSRSLQVLLLDVFYGKEDKRNPHMKAQCMLTSVNTATCVSSLQIRGRSAGIREPSVCKATRQLKEPRIVQAGSHTSRPMYSVQGTSELIGKGW